MAQVDREYARSVPEIMGRNGRYKIVLLCW